MKLTHEQAEFVKHIVALHVGKLTDTFICDLGMHTAEDEPMYQLVECPNCGDIWSEEIRQEVE